MATATPQEWGRGRLLAILAGALLAGVVLLAGLGLECSQLREMANTLYPSQLEQLKQAYGRQAGKFYPMPTQLSYGEKLEEDRQLDEAFLI